MRDIDELLKGTIVKDKIDETAMLYKELEKREEDFINTFNIHCGSKCNGECCHEFLPTITENEALYLAYGLISNDKDQEFLSNINNKNSKCCPFYKSEGQYHCMAYEYRPLLCRLFNAAASKDKYGDPCFRKCKFNEIGHGVSNEELIRNSDKVIMMSDFGSLLEDEEIDDEKDIKIYEAVRKAVEKIKLIIELKEENKTNT